MRRFFEAAFKITFFQILIIVLLSILKNILITYQLDDKIQKPFLFICLFAALLFLLSVSFIGIIENRGSSFDSWLIKEQKNRIEKLMAFFIKWGIVVPAALAYLLFLYIIIPTSWYMFIALYAGLVIRNVIRYFSKNQIKITET